MRSKLLSMPGTAQASRVIIRQAPMPDQPTIQPTITVIIAQVGIGGKPRAPRPPNRSGRGPGRRRRLR